MQVAYVIVASGCGKCDKVTPNSAAGIRVNSAGKELASKRYDTGKSGLNIYSLGGHVSTPGSSLSWNTADNTLGLVISRRMTKSGDGLNHQGAIAVVRISAIH